MKIAIKSSGDPFQNFDIWTKIRYHNFGKNRLSMFFDFLFPKFYKKGYVTFFSVTLQLSKGFTGLCSTEVVMDDSFQQALAGECIKVLIDLKHSLWLCTLQVPSVIFDRRYWPNFDCINLLLDRLLIFQRGKTLFSCLTQFRSKMRSNETHKI